MPSPESARSARILGGLLMGVAMLLLLATIFANLKPAVFVPIASMVLILAIVMLGKSKAEDEGPK